MDKPKLLVIEDDEPIRTQMKWALIRDYDIFVAADAEEAMQVIRQENPPVVTLDLGLPPCSEDTSVGLKLLTQILAEDPFVKIIVVSGNADKSSALQAISLGAHDFFTKPIDITELMYILKRAYYVYTLETEYKTLQNKLSDQHFAEMIGSCLKMQDVFTTVRKVATTDVPVLITGESGTGKELVARAIHSNSLRKDKPFVPINCGAIPEALLESELFGHEKGAFTGAHIQRKGKIESAHEGTFFLDEIGELPLTLQVKLLRFLQDYKIERIGGRELINVNLRIIAATNKDIKQLIAEGRFREDLYYRLAVVNIDLPPLRERGADIILLAKFFLQKFSNGAKPKTLSPEVIDAISSYKWPGNVRELENRMLRAVTFAEGSTIMLADIDMEAAGGQGKPKVLNMKKAIAELETQLINAALLKHNWNISKAAEDLGLSRPTLHHLIKRNNITR